MTTQGTPLPRSRGVFIALALSLACLAGVAPAASARNAEAEEGLPYANHRLAQQDLAWAEENLEAVRRRLAQREMEFEGLLGEATALVGREEELVRQVFETRGLADEYLVVSYVTGRSGTLSASLLATNHLNDALYLQTVINEQARSVAQAYADYQQLLEDSGEQLLFVLDRLDVVYRDMQLARRDLPILGERVEEAQWVAWVAAIHGQADEGMARRGRPEPTPSQWAALRHCESTASYLVNTGNGYYGAYQFDQTTWESVGGSGRPHWAAPVEQDARARLLYADRGSAPWPICGRYLP